MKRNLFKIFLLAAFVIAVSGINASAQNRLTVKLKLQDTITKAPIEFATVSLTPKGAKEVAFYALSTSSGDVTLEKVTSNTYTLKAELMGYVTLEKEVKIDKDNTNLGTISMKEDALALEAAQVTAVGNPIVVKQDTVEYTAALFKTAENSVLKDLLKKLPGVEVDSDGNITANGETIKKITVNGKTFFLDDPNIASESLPTNIIEKVKVIDKKSDQSIFSGIEDDNTEKIIDVSTYQGMYNGWFGNLEAGGGYDFRTDVDNRLRYKGTGMVGTFADKYNVFAVGNANNTGEGGFGRRGSRNSFSGRGGETSTWMGGLNLGYSGVENLEATVSMQLAGNSSYSESNTDRTTFQKESADLRSISESKSTMDSQSIEFGTEVKYNPGKTRVFFRPSFTFNESSHEQYSNSESTREEEVLNRSFSNGYTESGSRAASGNIMLGQRILKAGRTITLDFNYDVKQEGEDSKSYSRTDYVSADSVKVDQLSHTDEQSYSLGGNIRYTEPITSTWFISASYGLNYSYSNSVKRAFDYNGGIHDFNPSFMDQDMYSIENEYYSSVVNRKYIRQKAGLSLQYQNGRNFVQVGANLQPIYNETYTKTFGQESHVGADEWLINWAPSIRARYNISKSKSIDGNYRGSSNQPSTSKMQPILDISNPTSISTGNIYLLPSFQHRGEVRYRSTNRSTFASLNMGLSMTYDVRGIVSASWRDENAIRYSIPVNSKKPSSTFGANATYNTPIAMSAFSVASHTSANIGFSTSYQSEKDVMEGIPQEGFNYEAFMAQFWGDSSGNRFYDGLSGFQESRTNTYNVTERLTFRYNGDKLSVDLGMRARWNSAMYSLKPDANTSTWNNSVTGSILATPFTGTELNAEARYNFYMGYKDGYGDPEFILNASIAQTIGKFQIKASVRDLLNQQKNFSRTMSENYMQDTRTNNIGRYFLISVSYRFGTFKGMGGPGRMGGGFGGRR